MISTGKDVVYDWLAYHAAYGGDRLAVVDLATGRRFTYAQLNDRATRLATGLAQAHGVGKGDRVAILAHNSTDMFEVKFACWKLGAIFTPLNWRLHPKELEFLVSHADPKVLFYDDHLEAAVGPISLPKLRRTREAKTSAYEALIKAHEPDVVMAPAPYDDVQSLIYTSGTTGQPKGALYTYRIAMNVAVSAATHAAVNKDARALIFAPLFHAAPLYTGGTPLFHYGGTVYVMDQWDAKACLGYITDPDLGITHFNGVPTNFIMMQELPEFETATFPTIKMFGIGSAPISMDLLETWAAKGAILTQSYGMTEAFSVTLTSSDPDIARTQIGTAGTPMLHVEVRIGDDEGQEKPRGETGEIQVRGPGIIPGYYKAAELTKAAFFEDGWFRTGDAGRFNEDGTLTVVDRLKDMFISGGVNVYPSEVEHVISELDAVSQVAVIPVAHIKWGEVGLALIILTPGASLTEAEVQDACSARLARYKVPKKVEFVDTLPLSPQGKVLKTELKERYKTLSLDI